MIAVVDDHIEGGIVIGAAASPGVPSGLVQDESTSAFAKANRSGKPGKAGADYVYQARH